MRGKIICGGLALILLAFCLGLASSAQARTYSVQPGDTLWSISRRFETTVEAIKKHNGLQGDLIYPGQALNIPEPYQDLKEEIEAYLSEQPGTYGVFFQDLVSGKSFGINDEVPLPAASTVKLPAVLFINQLVYEGKLDWDEKIAYNASRDYQGGSGILQFTLQDGDKLTLRTLTTLAITLSDNIAYNMLRNFVGKETLAAYMKGLGGKTVFPGGQNLSTARDMGLYLKAALDFAQKSPDGRRFLDDLAHTIYNEGIPRGVPERVTVVHKEGFIWGSPADVGAVFGSRPFLLAVLSREVPDPDRGFNTNSPYS